uniref:Tyrosine-protein phosphatase domain-containing protein n=1 Tax=Xiphophorus couchianus TaxID=32473 RepID=A0A3B5LT12_9TELE
MPAYIATQGPLPHTISDFWQMVWENGCTVIVMMTALVEDGEKQCDRYWPDEGSSLYHIYEVGQVNLVSEHIWCNDFLVRSFYLKNVQTQETRTLTQFHFLSWPAQGIPTSTRPLLDFPDPRCYNQGTISDWLFLCFHSDGTGRTGTYILIDMVLNRMAKGVKEIDIAATLEHVRDQRPGMVRTKVSPNRTTPIHQTVAHTLRPRPRRRRCPSPPPRSPSPGPPCPPAPPRTRPPPCPRPRTSGRRPAWRTSGRTCGRGAPRPRRWPWCC